MTPSDIWRRVAVEGPGGSTLFLPLHTVLYLEAEGHDTLVHAGKRAPLRAPGRLAALERRLPSPPFFRCHQGYVVNLARVRALEPDGRDFVLRIDQAPGARIPVARGRLAAFRKLMGAP